jgi:hypothetical protein
MALDPLPMMPTILPSSGTFGFQSAEWIIGPLKELNSGGMYGNLKGPHPLIL